LSAELVDLERRVHSSQPDSDVHDPDTCLCCGFERLRLFELEDEVMERARRILLNLDRTHRPAQGRELPRR